MSKKFNVLSLCLLLTVAFAAELKAETVNVNGETSVDSAQLEDGRRGRRVRRGRSGRTHRPAPPRRHRGRVRPPRRVPRYPRPFPRYPRPMPRPFPRVARCSAELVDRGYVVNRFVATAPGVGPYARRNACGRALRRCEDYKFRTYSRGFCRVW